MLPMFSFVIETERRFYLANKVDVTTTDDGWVQRGAHRRVGLGHVPTGAVRLERPRHDPSRRQRRRAPARRHDDPRYARAAATRRTPPGRVGRRSTCQTAVCSRMEQRADVGRRGEGRRQTRLRRRVGTASWPGTGDAASASSTSCSPAAHALVFCEVKTRRGSRFGGGYEAVDVRKQQKLRAVAEVFLLQTKASPATVRFDVASVWVSPTAQRRSSSSRTPSDSRRSACDHRVDLGPRRQVVHDARAQVRAPAQRRDAHPRGAVHLERALDRVLVGVEVARRPTSLPTGRWRKHTTDSSGSTASSKSGADPMRLGEVGGQVDVVLHQTAEALGAQVLPAHPELQRPEPARALDRVLVPVQRRVLRRFDA